MADTILGILESIASAIDTLFGTGLASAVSGLRGRLGDWANSFGEATVWREPINASDLHLERMEYGDAWNKGYDWGSNFSIGDVLGLGNIPEISIPTYTPASSLLGDIGDIGKNTGKTAGNTSALKDAVDMTNEDLKMLVDMAERQYVAQVNLTAQSPVINITGQNTGNTADDRAAMADAIKRVAARAACLWNLPCVCKSVRGGARYGEQLRIVFCTGWTGYSYASQPGEERHQEGQRERRL